MNILSPSILAADFKNLGQQIADVDEAGRRIHALRRDGVFPVRRRTLHDEIETPCKKVGSHNIA